MGYYDAPKIPVEQGGPVRLSGDAQPIPYLLPGGIKATILATDENELQAKALSYIYGVDKKTNKARFDPGIGASTEARMAVGNAPSEQDKIKTLHKYYPNPMSTPDGNFIIYDRDRRMFTLYNSPGVDFGDVASVGRDVATFAGSVAGGSLGAAGGPATATAGAGVGGAAFGQAYDQALRSVMGTEDSRSTAQRLAQAGTDVASIGAGEGIFRAGPMIAKTIFGPVDKTASRNLLSSYDTYGVKPRLPGDITGNKLTQGFQAILARLPGGANTMNLAAKKTLGDIERAKNTSAQFFPGVGNSMEIAGQTIKRGAENFIDRFKKAEEIAMNRLNRWSGVAVTPANTISEVGRIKSNLSAFPRTAQHDTPSLYNALEDDLSYMGAMNQFTLSDMKALRSRIGTKLANPAMFDDPYRGDYKALYSALTNDMRTALAREDPRALAAFDHASKIWREGIDYAETNYRHILKEGVSPSAAYKWATSEVSHGGDKLSRVIRGFTNDEKDIVLGTIVNNMGRDADGTFDLAKFANDWGKVRTEARNVIFGRGNQGLGDAYEKLHDIIKNAQSTKTMANTSGTATSIPFIMLLGGGVGGVAGQGVEGAVTGLKIAAFSAMSSWSISKLMTSEKFVRWLVTPVKPNGIPAHLGRLSGIVASDPGMADSISEYVQSQFSNSSERQRNEEEGQ